MKTLNNITKRIYKTGLVLLAVLLLGSLNSFAGEFPKVKALNEVAVETEMKIENWMLNLSSWKSSSVAFYDVVDKEDEIEIEDWMLDANYANWENVELEEEIEMHDWMLDASDKHWNVDEEEVIELENWMTDLSTWK